MPTRITGLRSTVRGRNGSGARLSHQTKAMPSASETVGAARAQPGQAPGGGAVQQIEVTADVVAVDAKSQVVTLKGPQRTVELVVRDPAQFKLIKVGDQIQAVYAQALVLTVEPAPAVKK